MDDVVFPEPLNPNRRPLGMSEPAANWYLNSTRREAAAGREIINDLYRAFPGADSRLRRRLRSTVNADHFVALDELFTHHRMSQSCRVAYEEDGEGPDFRAYRGDEYLGAVEVASLFMRKDWADEEQKHGRLIDGINARVPLTTFFIHFEILRWDREPRVRDIADWLRRTVEELGDPKSCEDGPPVRMFSNRAVDLKFEFLPRQGNHEPEPHDRVVGTGAAIGGFVNSSLRLRDTLDSKAGGRYDLRGRPFAILVGIRDSFCSLDQVIDSLLGGEQVSFPEGRLSRRGDGFYGQSSQYPEGKNRRVSCVFTLLNWIPGGAGRPQIVRFDNPFCEAEFPPECLPADFRLRKA